MLAVEPSFATILAYGSARMFNGAIGKTNSVRSDGIVGPESLNLVKNLNLLNLIAELSRCQGPVSSNSFSAIHHECHPLGFILDCRFMLARFDGREADRAYLPRSQWMHRFIGKDRSEPMEYYFC